MSGGGRLVGALLGGGTVAAYYNGLDVTGTLRSLLTSPWQTRDFPVWQGAAGHDPFAASLRAVQGQLEQLRFDMNRQHGVTISMAGKQGPSSTVMVGVGAGGALVAYLRIVKGWKFADLIYVSRASLNRTMEAMNKGVEGVTRGLLDVRAHLEDRLRALRAKQDEAMEGQERLKGHLATVGRDVEAVGRDVAETREGVAEVQRSMEAANTEVLSRLGRATEGVEILARVVFTLMQGNAGGRTHARHDLESFLKSGPALEASSRPPMERMTSLLEGQPSGMKLLDLGQSMQHAHSTPVPARQSRNMFGWASSAAPPRPQPAPSLPAQLEVDAAVPPPAATPWQQANGHSPEAGLGAEGDGGP